MFKVSILASENALFSTVFGPFDMLIQAGVFWNMILGKEATPYFDVCISSVDGKEITGLRGAKIRPHCKIHSDDQYDLVIIPSEGMNINPHSQSFQKRVDYLKTMHDKGTVVASVCTGAFLVAATGLLNNKVATTHWAAAQEFMQLFPEVKLNTDLLVVDNHEIITAGGVSADQDLCMRLIARFCGHDVAIQTARCTLVDLSTREQAQFKTFVVEKNHGDQGILKCQLYIEKNIGKEISVAKLSEKFTISLRTLNRRFKQATRHSVISYIQQLRVEKAKYILERKNISFDEIAHDLGYENVSFFRKLFKQHVGLTPKDYRRGFFQAKEKRAKRGTPMTYELNKTRN